MVRTHLESNTIDPQGNASYTRDTYSAVLESEHRFVKFRRSTEDADLLRCCIGLKTGRVRGVAKVSSL
jgi:hypothetical protein